MTHCTEARFELLDRLGRNPSPGTRPALDGHLAECASCRRELDALREVWNSLPELEMTAPSPRIRASALAYAAAPSPGTATRSVRAILLGAVGALAGYLLLTAISPISDTVRICQIQVFQNAAMSMGQVCLVYLAIALLYAGVPMGIAAYMGGANLSWRGGLGAAGVFTLVTVPAAIVEFGLEDWSITLTVLAGLVAGSLAGGLGGTWIGHRRTLGAAAFG